MVDQKVHRALVIGLGREGEMAVQAFHERLQRRYNNIPIIGTLIIADQPPDAAGAAAQAAVLRVQEPRPVPTPSRRLFVDTDALDPADLNTTADISSWFQSQDTSSSGIQATRVLGRLALFKHVTEIRHLVGELLTEITAVQNEALLHDLNLSLHHERELDLIVVGSLGNPFASGIFLDLAYLLQYIGAQDQPEDMFIFVHGVALLPGFEGELVLEEADAAARQAYRSRWEANAYAALKELDYYMSGHRYRCQYRRSGEPDYIVVEQPADQCPFNEGSFYLVATTNEGNRGISRLTDATSMAAEWLVSVLATPLQLGLRPTSHDRHLPRYEGRVGAYGSFGLACWQIPLGDLKEYCVRRMARQLVRDCLLEDPPSQDVLRGELEDFRAANGLMRSDFSQQINNSRDWDPRSADYGIRPVQFDIVRPYAYRELEKALIREQDRVLREVLPLIRRGMFRNLERARTGLSEKLMRQARDMLDQEPAGSGSSKRTAAIFGMFQTDLATEHRALEGEIASVDNRVAVMDREIERARGRYFCAAQVFGPPPFLPVIGTVALLALLFYYTWSVLGRVLGEPWLAAGVIGAGALLFLFVSIAAFVHLTASRQRFVTLYKNRLELFRQQTEFSLLNTIYQDLSAWCTDVQDQLAAFLRKLETLQEETDRDFKTPAWQKLLYDAGQFVLEESVIKAEDVEGLYREVVRDNPRYDLAEIVGRSGLFHNWQLFKTEEIKRLLRDYAKERVGQIEGHQVFEYLNRMPDNDLRDRAYRLVNNSWPFWQCDIVHLAPPAAEPQRLLGVVEDGEQAGKTVRMLQAHETSLKVVGTGDSHRVTSLGLRRGIPLFAVTPVRRMRPAYEAVRSAGNVAALHVTRGNIALPDIMREGRIQPLTDPDSGLLLEPRRVFALANALGMLQRDADGGYCFEYVSELDQMLFARATQAAKAAIPTRKALLGATKSEACLTLYTNPEYLGLLAQEIIGPARRSGSELQPNARILRQRAQELRDYLALEADKGEIEDWEAIEIEDYLQTIVRLLGMKMPEARRPRARLVTGTKVD